MHISECWMQQLLRQFFFLTATIKQIHISAAQWPKIQDYHCSGQLPWCEYACVPHCYSSIKKTWLEGKVEFMMLGGRSERCLCWSRNAVLGPSVASHSSAWMQRVGVRPLHHRANNIAPDGSVLWPVTPRSGGQRGVNRGQSLRTPHGVPLSSKGRVAN